MTDLQQKQLDFLEETANHYSLLNRNVDEYGGCSYFPKHANTEGCAIGRKIEDKKLCKKLNILNYPVNTDQIFYELPNNLQELGKSFLINIQKLHDTEDYWDENGLSKLGKEEVERIKIIFKLK